MFDRPPSGFRRSRSAQGWLRPLPNPQAKAIKDLKAELAELRELLETQATKGSSEKEKDD